MLYAKVVFSLRIEGPFDYIVPIPLSQKIKIGARVWVPFRTQKNLGYVVALSAKTEIKNLKEILEVIDNVPLLDKNALLLTREISRYYCCSWGEAIDTALPEEIRKGKTVPVASAVKNKKSTPAGYTAVLLHDLQGQGLWKIYLQEIKKALKNNQSVIVLLPDVGSVLKTRDMLNRELGCDAAILYRKQPKELEQWIKIRSSQVSIVVGTRSGIFAPVQNLGLIIMDEEENSVYKQDQVPHYHAREVAFMRAKMEKARLILGSSAPSLESFYLAKRAKIQYAAIARSAAYPEVKIIDTKDLSPWLRRKNIIFFQYLIDLIFSTLNNNGKALLFLNRKGFATFASCRACGAVLRCPRCNINLVYHFKGNILRCHYCNFKIEPPNICPKCNSGYIRYAGMGTEKIESELCRLFPQAKIKRLEAHAAGSIDEADIFVSAESVVRQANFIFDLIAILSIDNSLNRIDFRSAEKTFRLLINLVKLTEKKVIIQTALKHHHCFRALIKADENIFYDEELIERKSLQFPPYKHLAVVKLRGKNEEKVEQASRVVFNLLNKRNTGKNIKIISVNPAQPPKMRGNFYWQILIKTSNPGQLTDFLKINLKDFLHSGIIVTVDVDPI